MTGQDLLLIAVCVASSVLSRIAIDIYRALRRARHGPSQKEFTNAVTIVTEFINHHNRVNPEATIKALTISPTKINVSAAIV